MILAPPPPPGGALGELPPHAPRYPTGFVIKAFNYRYGSIVSTSYQHQINEDLMNIESTSIIIVSTSLLFQCKYFTHFQWKFLHIVAGIF